MCSKPGRYVPFFLAALSVAGCGTLPLPASKGDPQGKSGTWGEDQSAKSYCKELANVADKKGQKFLGLGIVGGIVASGLAVAGASMGAGTGNWAAENRNALVIGSGAVVAVPTTVFLTRARDASGTSGAASAVMLDDDAYKKCLAARSGYSMGRGAVATSAGSSFDDLIKNAQKAAEEEAKKQEEEAKEAEKDAATAADEAADEEAAVKALVEAPGDPAYAKAVAEKGAADQRSQDATERARKERAEADVARDVATRVKLKLQGLRDGKRDPSDEK